MVPDFGAGLISKSSSGKFRLRCQCRFTLNESVLIPWVECDMVHRVYGYGVWCMAVCDYFPFFHHVKV